MNFKHYFPNDELETVLKDWRETYPDLTHLNEIGRSHEGRPIWLLTLTNQKTGPADEKPAIWLDANIHATEIAGTTTALYIAHHLLSGYAQEARLKDLLDRATVYIVPRVNPDGAAQAMSATPRYIRSGVRQYPWEDKHEGLHSQDINQDGRILQMRIKDQNGAWKVSALDARLMEKREPDESGGEYYRLLPEGLLHEFDGHTIRIARPPEGLDFNRNFPFEWRPENEQRGAGPYPTSEPEIRALADFITRHPNINLAITYHTFSRVILRPYGTKSDDEMDTDDLWTFKKIGAIGSKHTGYRCVSTFHDFKYHPKEVITGVFDDWMYDHFGVYCFTIELWDLPTEAGIKERKFIDWWREHPHEEDVLILKWAMEHAPESFVDWQPFDHPQLGRVELGGWENMYVWRNPPPDLMEAEAARQYPFILSIGDILPRLAIHALEVTSLGGGADDGGTDDGGVDDGGVYRVNLVVDNTGFLPTYTSQQSKKRGAVRPVRVELELSEGLSLASGKMRTELGHLEGRAADLSVSANSAADPTSHRARLEWVLRTAPGLADETRCITLKVLSERAGVIRRTIKLA